MLKTKLQKFLRKLEKEGWGSKKRNDSEKGKEQESASEMFKTLY